MRGRGPRPADGTRHRPARGHRGRVRADRAREAGAVADLGTQQAQVFSPDSKDPTKKVAHIRFRVRNSENIESGSEDSDGKKIDTLLSHRSVRKGELVRLVWDSFTPSGVGVPDGTYRAVVKLEHSHRTIVMPSDITVDTSPPHITARPPNKYPIISPDGDGHADVFRIPYEVSEPAHAILLLRGKQAVYTNGQKTKGTLVWNGKVPGSTRVAPPGRYVLAIAARDRAGNQSTGVRIAIGQVRYLTLARTRVVVAPGGRFALRVSTDAPQVDWLLHGRHGTLPRGTLHLRAPKSAGVYRLYSRSGATPRSARWWWRERGSGAGRGRTRGAGAGDADGRAPTRSAARRARCLGGRLRWSRRLPRAARAPPPSRGRGGAGPGRGCGGRSARRAHPVAARTRDARLRAARIPVHVGSTQANLLLPLYGIVVVAAIALAWELFGDGERHESSAAREPARRCSSRGKG